VLELKLRLLAGTVPELQKYAHQDNFEDIRVTSDPGEFKTFPGRPGKARPRRPS
jgi:hypothetical protein